MFLSISSYLGNIYDLNVLNQLKHLNLTLSSPFLLPINNQADRFFASPNNYFIDYSAIETSSSMFLVGVNLRQSLPVLNAKIKSFVKAKGLAILVVGPFSNFNFQVKHLTTSNTGWMYILEGFHWSSSLLASSKIFGSNNWLNGNIIGEGAFKLFTNPAEKDINLISTALFNSNQFLAFG